MSRLFVFFIIMFAIVACGGGAPAERGASADSSGTAGGAPTSNSESTTTSGVTTEKATAEESSSSGSAPPIDCGMPDWTDPGWVSRTHCFYVVDVSPHFFNNWCYRTGDCDPGQPPPGKTVEDMIFDHDTLTAVSSLQGLVNRDAPTLYVIGSQEPDETWLEVLPQEEIWLEDFIRHDVHSVSELLQLFEGHPAVEGSVVWDAFEPHTMNIALSLAAARNLVVVREGSQIQAEVEGAFPAAEHLGGRFESKRAAYEWLIDVGMTGEELEPRVALTADGALVRGYLEGAFEPVGHGLLSRDIHIARKTFFIGYGVHPSGPDPTQSPPAPPGEGREVLQLVFDAIRSRVGSSVFEASGWPPSDYSFDCNGDGTVDSSDHVQCEEWMWVEFLSENGGVLMGGPAGLYAKESANKSFFQHGPGDVHLVQPAPLSPVDLLTRGFAHGPPANASFEDGASGEWTMTATNRAVYEDPELAHGGTRFLQMSVDPKDLGEGISQSVGVSIERGRRYRFSVHARAPDGSLDLRVRVGSGNATLCEETVSVASNDWIEGGCEFQHRSAGLESVQLELAVMTAGRNVAVDDVWLAGATSLNVDVERDYVMFYLGDYDFPMAMQLVPIGVHPHPWNQRHAAIPTAVGMTAYARELTPPIFAYFAKTKTANQTFVMTDSGAGYVNPGHLPSGTVPSWLEHTASLQRPVGYRTGWVLNGSAWAQVPANNATGSSIRSIYRSLAPEGVYYNAPANHTQLVDGAGLPVVPLAGGVLAAGLNTKTAANNLRATLELSPHAFNAIRTVFVSDEAVEAMVEQTRADGTPVEVLDPNTFMMLFAASEGRQIFGRLSVVAHTLPSRVGAGQQVSASVAVRNDGWDIWTPAELANDDCDGSGEAGSSCDRIAIAVAPSGDIQPTGRGETPTAPYATRVELPTRVLPGETVDVDLEFTAPARPGSWVIQLDGVKENRHFFETVGNVPWQWALEVE